MGEARTYNGARHHEGPPTSSGIGLDGLDHSHPKLGFFGIDGACSVVVDLLGGIIVNRPAPQGGRLRLDLQRRGLLLCGVASHVDTFRERNEKRVSERETGTTGGFQTFIRVTALEHARGGDLDLSFA